MPVVTIPSSLISSGAGGGEWVLLSTKTASGTSTIDFSTSGGDFDNTTYKDYKWVLRNLYFGGMGTTDDVFFRTAVDANGTTIRSGTADYLYKYTHMDNSDPPSEDQNHDLAHSSIQLVNDVNNPVSKLGLSGEIILYDATATDHDKEFHYTVSSQSQTDGQVFQHGYGKSNSNSPITGISFDAAGNVTYDTGEILMFGRA
jgi:hypothetical protein